MPNPYVIRLRFQDNSGNYLTSGTSLGGDGAILQLGYYTGATQADPFAGTWVPLTGPETGLRSTTGDSGGWLDGTFNLIHHFKASSPNVPVIGTPLAIPESSAALLAACGALLALRRRRA